MKVGPSDHDVAESRGYKDRIDKSIGCLCVWMCVEGGEICILCVCVCVCESIVYVVHVCVSIVYVVRVCVYERESVCVCIMCVPPTF